MQRIKPVNVSVVIFAGTISHKLRRFDIEIGQACGRVFQEDFIEKCSRAGNDKVVDRVGRR